MVAGVTEAGQLVLDLSARSMISHGAATDNREGYCSLPLSIISHASESTY